tara:strand:- start:42 stop:893 length:852 start_codon:yes stop_codon:yes gene_type:complete
MSCNKESNELSITQCEKGYICYEENGIQKSFESDGERHLDNVIVIGELFDISIKIQQLQEGNYIFSAGTLDEARSVRYASDSITLDHFSSSYENTIQGELEVTNYDQINQTISGNFEFKLIQFTGLEEKELKLEKGTINEISIYDGTSFNSDGTFKGVIEPSPFDSLAFYFLNVLDLGESLQISMAHPTGNNFIIKFPKDLTAGEHEIQVTELNDIDEFQIQLKTNRNGDPYYIPTSNEPLKLIVHNYSEIDRILNIELQGTIKQASGETLNLKNFIIDLHSW